jgi:hypothetical protein
LDTDSGPWPCELSGAQNLKLKIPAGEPPKPRPEPVVRPGGLAAEAELEPNQTQDRGNLIPELLTLKPKANLNMKFHVPFEAGNESQSPEQLAIDEINKLLEGVQEESRLRK